MNRILFTIFLLCFTAAFGQKNLKVYLDSKQYYAPEIGNYLEIQLLFAGYSIVYDDLSDSTMQGEVAIAIQLSQNDSVVLNDVYRLTTPVMRDSVVDDFYDIRRFPVKPGVYNMTLEVADINSANEPLRAVQPLVIEDYTSNIFISDVQVAEYARKGDGSSMFFKSGYDIYPRLSDYFADDAQTIPVYFEIYNTHLLTDSVFGLSQRVIDANTGEELHELSYTTRMNGSEVVPVIRQLEIEELKSGTYIIEYSVLSRDMKEMANMAYSFEREKAERTFTSTADVILDPAFQESMTDDSVAYYLASLIPISKPGEVRSILSILKKKDAEVQRKYIQQFWIHTSGNIKAYEEWIKYKLQVQLVERLYSNNFMRGFETDRGRVYLQYGAPTMIVTQPNSPTEYPYEIWQYNKIGVFSNKRFIFYNPDLVNNNYRLLHSDMVGELKNNGWPQALAKRNTTNGNVDDPNGTTQEHYGGNSNSLYRQY